MSPTISGTRGEERKETKSGLQDVGFRLRQRRHKSFTDPSSKCKSFYDYSLINIKTTFAGPGLYDIISG